MNITLKRTGTIAAFESIASINSYQKNRQDIFEIIQFIDDNKVADAAKLAEKIGDNTGVIAIGIIQYFINLGLVNERDHTLTLRASNFLIDGLFPSAERGKFRFWTLDDSLIGKQILGKSFSEHKHNQSTKLIEIGNVSDFKGKRYINHFDENNGLFEVKEFSSSQTKLIVGEATAENSAYELKWKIKFDEDIESNLFITGQLRNGFQKHYIKNSNFKVELDKNEIKLLIYELLRQAQPKGSEWDEIHQCFRIPYKDNLSKEVLDSMKFSLKLQKMETSKYNEFEEVLIEKIPVRPLTLDDAYNWFSYHLEKYLEKDYRSFEEVENRKNEILTWSQFEGFSKDIEKRFSIESFTKKLKEEEKMSSYWNLVTPQDLYIQLDKKYIVDGNIHNIAEGEKMSMLEFVRSIIQQTKPDTLVFTSKYLEHEQQQKKFECFVEAFRECGAKNIHLIKTQNNNYKNNFIEIHAFEKLFNNRKLPHDRYFAYRADDEWYYYKLSAELDQAIFENINQATIYTEASWRDITFIQIKKAIFPKPLSRLIHEQLNEVLQS